MIKKLTTRDLARRATVAITMTLRGSPHLIGTGLLVDINDHSFVVTAAHVVKGSQKYEGEFGFVDMNGNFVALDDDWKCSPLRNYGTACDPIDVAVHQIDPYRRDQLNHAMFLNLEDMDLTPCTSVQTFYLYGFPFSLMERDETKAGKLLLRPLTISFSVYSGSTYLIGDYEEQLHLLLDARQLDVQDTIVEGSDLEFKRTIFCSLLRSIEGISGSGVWSEDVEKGEKIVALQTGVYHRQHIIKATRWIMVMRLLYDFFPDIGSVAQ